MNGVHIKRRSTHTQAYAHHRAARFAIALQMLISYHHSSPSQFSRRMVSICLPPFHLKRHKQNVIIFALFLLFLSLHRFFFWHTQTRTPNWQNFVATNVCVLMCKLLSIDAYCIPKLCMYAFQKPKKQKQNACLIACLRERAWFIFIFLLCHCLSIAIRFVCCEMCNVHITHQSCVKKTTEWDNCENK